jgi:gas vesicle protein
MSKKLIALLILVGIAGVAIGIFTNWNPIATVQAFIKNPLGSLQPALDFIKQNIVGSILGFFTAIGLAVKAVQGIKQSGRRVEEDLKGQVSNLSTVNAELQTSKEQLETQFKETTLTYSDNFKEMSGNFVKVQEELRDERERNEQLAKQLQDEQEYYQGEIKRLKDKAEKAKLVA